MKTFIIKPFIFSFILATFCLSANAQAILNTGDSGPIDPVEGAALDIRSVNSGLLIPYVALENNALGEVYAPGIAVTPADGLIVYNNASTTNVTKGLWYYDAAPPNPHWVLYSDFSSTLSDRELDDFGEMYESNDIGTGTYYELSPDYFIPWESATKGLTGSAFSFKDGEPVSTGIGTATADQFWISSEDAVYSVVISATLVASAPATTVTGALYINNTKVNHIFFRHTFQLKDKPTSLNTSGNIEVKSGDKIDFRFTSDVKNKGLYIENMNLRLTKMGEL